MKTSLFFFILIFISTPTLFGVKRSGDHKPSENILPKTRAALDKMKLLRVIKNSSDHVTKIRVLWPIAYDQNTQCIQSLKNKFVASYMLCKHFYKIALDHPRADECLDFSDIFSDIAYETLETLEFDHIHPLVINRFLELKTNLNNNYATPASSPVAIEHGLTSLETLLNAAKEDEC